MTTQATAAERAERGRAARSAVPRSSHGGYEPAGGRPDPIALLEAQAATRVPELVPIRYGRMLLLAVRVLSRRSGDHGRRPRADAVVPASTCSCCGDAHLSNFGVFGSPERRLVFDVNDFDETLPGPWEWDLKRLVASIEIAGREQRLRQRERERDMLATRRVVPRDDGASSRRMRNLDVWYARARRRAPSARGSADEVDAPDAQASRGKVVAKARTRDSMDALAKLTQHRRRTAAHRLQAAADRPARRALDEEPSATSSRRSAA